MSRSFFRVVVSRTTIPPRKQLSAPAASAQPSQDGMATLEAFLDGVRTLTADFKQELWTSDERKLQTDTGSLSLKRPNRFRWTYEAPAELIIVADGEQLWIYDVELKQVQAEANATELALNTK